MFFHTYLMLAPFVPWSWSGQSSWPFRRISACTFPLIAFRVWTKDRAVVKEQSAPG